MTTPAYSPHFNGPAYEPSRDFRRLTRQHDRVREAMLDGRWRSLPEIEMLTGDPPASISAQLRHLRKMRFGSYLVERRLRGCSAGLYEYRVQHPQKGEQLEIEFPDDEDPDQQGVA